jgi:hypothetical protein
MRDKHHTNVGRSPQRSEAISGDEAKGLTPISAERAIQPEAVALTIAARSLRSRPRLSLPLHRANKTAGASVTPDQA